ncbi:MAG: ubiquinol-cytochrome c reductase iron-sulfur subunit [Gammaproteobacteria bacterium]|nr:ubiquinol-cytochrome c reductase iron-sulfur subunit [Gammaproteobacteria bacterium]MCY4358690.1 ubiquinol-cytochrome c reductase iron-sulfur subunit [Gammaproteobacteria bacterium]
MTDDSKNVGRRRFLVGSTSALGVAGVAGAAVPFVGSWNPSAKARAAGAPVRIDISRLQPGEMLGPIPAWRGRPIFVIRRSEEALSVLNEAPGRLIDPESEQPEQPDYARNDTRSRNPEVLVLVGLCPHLFCSPTPFIQVRPEPFDREWRGGFFCPCHGSRFDLAGRVFAGSPASRNMQVPPHSYEGGNILVVGIDEENMA